MFEKSKDRYLTRGVDAEIPLYLLANVSLGCSGQHARTERLLAGVSAQRRERFADRTPYLGTTAV